MKITPDLKKSPDCIIHYLTVSNIFPLVFRLVDHLENTKGFNLRQLKYLILDEADRILNLDFEKEVDKILSCLPKVEMVK